MLLHFLIYLAVIRTAFFIDIFEFFNEAVLFIYFLYSLNVMETIELVLHP